MQKFVINCFEAYTNTDLMEGKGIDKHIGFFTKEADAKKASQGKGPMGYEAYTRKVNKTIYIYDSYDEFISQANDKKIEKIKNKLTESELELLTQHLTKNK